MDIQEHVPLAPFTTFGIGGEASFFTRVRGVEEIKEALAFAKEKDLQVCMLGGGSNTLFDDAGFQGLVIKVEIAGVELERDGITALLIAGAGESWDAVVARAVRENLWGVENLSNIPGTVGGAWRKTSVHTARRSRKRSGGSRCTIPEAERYKNFPMRSVCSATATAFLNRKTADMSFCGRRWSFRLRRSPFCRIETWRSDSKMLCSV